MTLNSGKIAFLMGFMHLCLQELPSLTIILYASPFSVYTDYIYAYVKNVHRLITSPSLCRHGVAG